MINYENSSTVALMDMHRLYKVALSKPLGHLRFPNAAANLPEIERVLLLRVPVLHLWEMEKLQRDNNITHD